MNWYKTFTVQHLPSANVYLVKFYSVVTGDMCEICNELEMDLLTKSLVKRGYTRGGGE